MDRERIARQEPRSEQTDMYIYRSHSRAEQSKAEQSPSQGKAS